MAKGKSDGSVNFSTKIDTTGFKKGLKEIQKLNDQGVEKVKESGKKSSEDAEKNVDSATKKIKKKSQEAADTVKKSAKESAEKTKNEAAAASDNVKKEAAKAESAVKKSNEEIEYKSVITARNVNVQYDNLFRGMEDGSKDAAGELANSFKKVEAESENVSFESFNGNLEGAMTSGKVAVGGLAAAVAGITAVVAKVGIDSEKAANQVAAATGLTGEKLEEVQGVASNVYQNNFGESMEDAANAVSEVYQQTKLEGDELEKTSESALLLRDSFEFEVNESVRTAKALMDNFGISAEEAYNLMVQGAQNGLNKNGDMLDTLNEYAVHYSNLGYTVEEFLGSLENGTKAGTFSVDKIGDAMKEFGIRIKDTSNTTKEAFEMLGYTAEADLKQEAERKDKIEELSGTIADLEKKLKYATMEQQNFNDKTTDLTRLKNEDTIKEYTEQLDQAKKSMEALQTPIDTTGKSMADIQAKFAAGGDSAREATQEVLTQLQNIDDDVARNQIGVDLFGTMWEDLGEEAVYSLLNTQTEIYATSDALENLNNVKYDDVQSQMEELKRTVKVQILQPLAKKLMPKLKQGVNWVEDHLDEIVDDLVPVGKAVATAFAVKKVVDFGTTAAKTVKGISSAIKMMPSLANPYVLAAAAVAGVGIAVYEDLKTAKEHIVRIDDYTQGLIDKQDKLNKKLDEQRGTYNKWEKERESAVDTVETEYSHYQNLANVLDNIVDKNGKIKEGYENRAKAITGELSEALGVEINIVDGQIQQYDTLKGKIEDIMALKKANALIDANQESYTEAQKGLAESGVTYSESLDNEEALERRIKKLQTAQEDFNKLGTNFTAGTDEYYAAMDKFLENYGKMLDIGSDDLYNHGGAVYDQIADSIDESSKKLDEAREKTQESLDTITNYQSIIKNYEDAQTAIASGNVDAIEECNVRLTNNLQTVETGTGNSLQRQRDEAKKHWVDLKDKYDRGVIGITESMVSAAEETYIITQNELDKFVANAESCAKQGGANVATGFSEGLDENLTTITDSLGNVSKAISESAAELYQWGMDNGYNYAAGLAAGINDPGNTLAAEEASKAIDRATRDALDIHSPSRVAKKSGEYYSQGLAEGIVDASGQAVDAAKMVADGINIGTQVELAPWSGQKMAETVGIKSDGQETTNTAAPGAGWGGDIVIPVSMFPNSAAFDTVVLSAKDRLNAVSGGRDF